MSRVRQAIQELEWPQVPQAALGHVQSGPQASRKPIGRPQPKRKRRWQHLLKRHAWNPWLDLITILLATRTIPYTMLRD